MRTLDEKYHRMVPRLTTREVVHEDFGWHQDWQHGLLCMRTLLDFQQGFGEAWSVLGLNKLGYRVTSNDHSDASRAPTGG